jgi:hypothetical protein
MNTRNELFELVFEELPEAVALSIASELAGHAIEARSPEAETLDEEIEQLKISDSVVIKRPHVRVLCYGDRIYDVELNFSLADVDELVPGRLSVDLQTFAACLVKPFDSVSFFAGLEPASDEDTRIFTNEEMGPLTLSLG